MTDAIREYALMANLNHQNIVKTYQVFPLPAADGDDGAFRVCTLMELCRFGSLQVSHLRVARVCV